MALNDTAPFAAPAEAKPVSRTLAGGLLAAFGAVTGIGAVLASSCCVVPLLLSSLGAGAGLFSVLEVLVPWRTPLLVGSALAIAGGWVVWWRKQPVTCEPNSVCATPGRSRALMAALMVASLIVVTATIWDDLEPLLLKLMRVG